ncbi:MAG: hypothetical protein ABI402_07790 [Ferruginibacter sp.]
MKKILFLVILLSGITLAKHAYAQSNQSPIFDIPAEKFNREFTVELERKNRMQVSVTSMQVMDYISNIDSILKVFLNELYLIQDSLPLRTVALRLDYNADDPTVKKLRVRKNIPHDDYYAFIYSSPSLLKMEQDTVVIHGKIPAEWLRRSKKFKEADYGKYFFSVTFYLNDLEDLLSYKDGRLNDKITLIQQHYRERWTYRDDERMQLKDYPEITSNTAKGYILHSTPFMIKKSVEVQNYKDHFIPSISCTPVFIKKGDFIKREFGISIEAAFSFENKVAATTKTHINVFAGFTYSVIPLTKTGYWVKLHPNISIAYLVSRNGPLYDKSSFRLGLGSFSAGNLTTRIEPALYFNNLFKNVSPSLRIVQKF